ncbi:MAG: bifunctional methylenetetrahydrofolate dehydrogenase/methenyltetrahydrofolate cyclohydrolase FolD [Deltaproteobacteria bacterium]|nr:bifunctional methylenetetrahydrofolate dehydrogenase/methenyltetrahydrofolate cyclohydrolase FolD [Deltaproteobacteria bacterium]
MAPPAKPLARRVRKGDRAFVTRARIIDGKAIAAKVRGEVKAAVDQRRAAGHRPPGLATVLVGQDPASHTYVKNKRKAAAETGIESFHHELPESTSQDELLALLRSLNADPGVDGILVQLPVPKHIDDRVILRALDPDKDVDGFHPDNVARLVLGLPGFVPCTPLGCLRLLDEEKLELKGARAVVVGRSNIVGKPMAQLLLQRDATVTIAHSKTRDLPALCREADVLVAAVGRTKMLGKDAIKPGAVVIDVGINRDAEGKLCGDVDFGPASEVAGAITPVPGGVGPMTIAMLMQNTLTSHARRLGIH